MSEADEKGLTVTYHVFTEQDGLNLVERLRAACGGRADGAESPYFLKRYNTPFERVVARVQEHQELARQYPGMFRDTRGLPFHEAGAAFWVGDEEWIVTASPDGAACVYRYKRDGTGTSSSADGWDLD